MREESFYLALSMQRTMALSTTILRQSSTVTARLRTGASFRTLTFSGLLALFVLDTSFGLFTVG